MAASSATLQELAVTCGTIDSRVEVRAGANKTDFERFMASFLFASGGPRSTLKAPIALERIR
jgi:hypothetical protein